MRHQGILRRHVVSLIVSILLVGSAISVLVSWSEAGWVGHRPIADHDFDQSYLYTMFSPITGAFHKAIDIPAVINTNVLAVADGLVVDLDLREDLPNGSEATTYGNFLLVRGSRRYFVNQNTAHRSCRWDMFTTFMLTLRSLA